MEESINNVTQMETVIVKLDTLVTNANLVQLDIMELNVELVIAMLEGHQLKFATLVMVNVDVNLDIQE